MTEKATLELTQANFEDEVLRSQEPVLVDFWAGWCGPCRAIAPTLDALAEDVRGTAKVGKVEIDENPQLAETYGIRSIPTMVLFQNGAEVDRIVGVTSGGVLKQKLQELSNAA